MNRRKPKTPIIKFAKLDDFRSQRQNANKHTDRGLAMLDEAMTEDGYVAPMTAAADGEVIDGSARLERAGECFSQEVIVIEHDGLRPIITKRIDIPNAKSDLAKRIALRANRIAQVDLNWDPELLMKLESNPELHLDQLFTPEEWRRILAQVPTEASEAPDPQIERAAEFQKKWQVKVGDLWEIPSADRKRKHRLLCGDCTEPDEVSRLMNGQRALLFATDPPYLVDYDGTNHPHAFHQKDKNKDWSASYGHVNWDESGKNDELYINFIKMAVDVAIAPNAAWYCWHASRRQSMLEAAWIQAGAFVHQQIIWVKDRPILTRSWYMWQHEPCFFGWVKGNEPPRMADDHPSSVWEIPTIAPGTKTDHPTSKPVEVFAIPMRQHTVIGDICYEPFAGSGTQIVAAEQLQRVCYALELEPKYCAVTLERLSQMGLKPKLLKQQRVKVKKAA
jgi:DNA modification methylase